MKLEGKVAIVTGGARGIGAAICRRYADEGARVAVADMLEGRGARRWRAKSATTRSRLRSTSRSGPRSPPWSRASWRSAGGIDILVNNAAIFEMAPLLEITEASYDKQFAVNVKGLLFTLQAVAAQMVKQGRGGKIVNFASQAGRRGEPLVAVYCASKAAVISLTQSAGLALIKNGINVNGIAPGVVDTPMWDQVDALFAKYEGLPLGEKKRAGRRGRALRPDGRAGGSDRCRGVPRLLGCRLRRRPDPQRRRRQLDELMGRQADGAFDLVIFDLDGVLVDSELLGARVTAAALAEAGIEITEAELCERFLGISTAAMLHTIEAEHGCELPASFREALRLRVLKAFEHKLQEVAGVRPVLDALAVKRCVASSSHPERIWRSLELVGLLDRLAPNLFSATMVEHGKPAPDLFLLAAGRMGAEPARCLVIEDSEVGVRAGKAAGMTTFGFTGASHVRPQTHGPRLLAAGADAIFAEMAALAGLIAAVP